MYFPARLSGHRLAGSIRFGSACVLRRDFKACASMTCGIPLLRWASLAGLAYPSSVHFLVTNTQPQPGAMPTYPQIPFGRLMTLLA